MTGRAVTQTVTNSTKPPADYYRVLGVDPCATHEEIKAAYRSRVRLSHPDLAADETKATRLAATETTARLNEAYRCLGDPDRRRRYDERTHAGTASRPGHFVEDHDLAATEGSDHRLRDLATTVVGGIVLPVLVLMWVSGLLPASAPSHPTIIAVFAAAALTVNTWQLWSSLLLRRQTSLLSSRAIWGRLMRALGWAAIGVGVVLLAVPMAALTVAAVFAVPLLGTLLFVAVLTSRDR